MAIKQGFATVVDIGSTKITGLAGEKDQNGKIRILGHAIVPSRGIKRGIILNPGELALALEELIAQLESQTGEKIKTVDVSLAGQGISTIVYEGVRHIESGIVTRSDMDYLENEALKMPLTPGNRIYHMFPRSFGIGDDPNVSVPVGHEGRKLTARYTIMSAPSSYQESVEKALSATGIQLGNFVLSPYAISEAVVSGEEKDLGVVVMDIGGGNTKMTTYIDGKLINMAVIPFGGEVITKDIKETFTILLKKAERLKIEYGQAIGDFAEEEKVVSIPGSEGWEKKEISFKSLAYIIQARLEEIIDSVYQEIEKSEQARLTFQGIVLTGGTSKMLNLLQLVKYRTGMDARLGFLQVTLADTPDLDKNSFMGALGLLKLNLQNPDQVPAARQERKKREINRIPFSGSKLLSNLSEKIYQQIKIIFDEDNVKS
jgi:cell division protein FtsA